MDGDNADVKSDDIVKPNVSNPSAPSASAESDGGVCEASDGSSSYDDDACEACEDCEAGEACECCGEACEADIAREETDDVVCEASDRSLSSYNDDILYACEAEVAMAKATGIPMVPYLWEPMPDSDDEEREVNPNPDEGRVGNNEWCLCGHCPAMKKVKESVCCKEVPEVKKVTAEDPGKECITDHESFHPVCLHPSVLRVAHYAYKNVGEEPDTNVLLRYIAYRQLARWCWKYVQRNISVFVPACAVSRIRAEFPIKDGEYNGLNKP